MSWNVAGLKPTATAISASRRTDIPGLFPAWFDHRLNEGFAEYIPAGPPRRIRRSLRPEDVTHFNSWSKWPRPFFRVLERVLSMGYPVLWNVTCTGLGQTDVEPRVPLPAKVVKSIRDLAGMVSPSAIQWRYDPTFVSDRFNKTWHKETFSRLSGELAGHVDRVAVSFVEPYGRRVKPDLDRYQAETGDVFRKLPLQRRTEIVSRLNDIATSAGMRLTVCCSADVRREVGLPASGCNSFDWACRVYPCLRGFRRLRKKPTRADCACSEEADIGVYDTCTFGCVYTYGSCNGECAATNFRKHDPHAPCPHPVNASDA